MLKVWTDAAEAGLLDRNGDRGSTFAYLPQITPARAVSVTMPPRLSSWTLPVGLPPVFEMNLPEGFLRERYALLSQKPPAPLTNSTFSRSSAVHRSAASAIPATRNNCTRTCQFNRSMKSLPIDPAATYSGTCWKSLRPSRASAAFSPKCLCATKRVPIIASHKATEGRHT